MSTQALRGYLAIQRRALMLLEREHGESVLLTTALDSNAKMSKVLGPDPLAELIIRIGPARGTKIRLVDASRVPED